MKRRFKIEPHRNRNRPTSQEVSPGWTFGRLTRFVSRSSQWTRQSTPWKSSSLGRENEWFVRSRRTNNRRWNNSINGVNKQSRNWSTTFPNNNGNNSKSIEWIYSKERRNTTRSRFILSRHSSDRTTFNSLFLHFWSTTISFGDRQIKRIHRVLIIITNDRAKVRKTQIYKKLYRTSSKSNGFVRRNDRSIVRRASKSFPLLLKKNF